jgi:hypothetical protein
VLVPIIGVDGGSGLTAANRELPIGVACCHPVFLGAHGPTPFEVKVPGKHVDDGVAEGCFSHRSQCHEPNIRCLGKMFLVAGAPAVVLRRFRQAGVDRAQATSSTASHGATATVVGVTPAKAMASRWRWDWST